MVVGSGRPDVAGLWIDFLLLPERLEEHLERLRSGATSSPTHAELINMFLDQAMSSYKLTRKEPEPQATSTPAPIRSDNRTSTLLCERAVRVVLAASFTLSDIESVVPKHLALLLKALIKFDRPRSLLHECNLRRWILHRALTPESLGSAFATTSSIKSSAPAPAPAPGESSPSEFFQDSPDSGGGEESSAVAFLENVLEREKQVNGVTRSEAGLEPGFICKILFDVAEAHFMRGRIKRAEELFTRCGEIPEPESEPHPVPRDRLNGFIVACRSVIGSGAAQSEVSASQETIFLCEKGRVSLKRKSEDCNGGSRVKLQRISRENGALEKHLSNGCLEENKAEPENEKRTGDENPRDDEEMLRVLVEDLIPRRLSWPYCFSLESDVSLPSSVRVKVSACNVLRKVVEGGAFESFLRISYRVEEEGREAGVFLLELMARVVSSGEEKMVSRVRQFCIYVCRTLDQSWCWRLGVKLGLVSPEVAGKLSRAIHEDASVAGGSTGLATLDILQAESFTAVEQAVKASAGDEVVRVVRMRAFHALERDKDSNLARQLYSLAKRLHPGSMDTELFLWLLGCELPVEVDGFDEPTPRAAEYVVVKLLEARHWSRVRELCGWAEERRLSESKRVGLVFKEASLLGALVPLCSSPNPEEVVSKLEELMALVTRSRRVLIISKLSCVEVLEVLESLVAGWVARASSPLVELARYKSSLAQLGSSSKARESECGKKLLEALLQRLLKLPRAPEEERKRGCRCLLGLADLAFVDQAYLEALQFYLQAGAWRSSFYCDRVTSMARELFTPWVITRMIAACKEIGAQIQAAILCQCLPDPDYESAFQILLANPLIVDQDAALYFECVWEIPLLELLLNMHAKAGDKGRVNILIGILQQPALNVHNPASIRKAHIAAMEQRFLQRFYAELM